MPFISALRMIEGEIISKINKCSMLVIVGDLELHALSINDINYVIFNGENEKLKAIENEIKNVAKTMEDFNKALVGYGVEYCRSISHENDFEYVNLGDTYLNTICYYKGKFRICCYGDIVEEHMDDFE